MSRPEGFDLVALVPMRHHSERVPGKNYRELAGKPLYEYILGALRQVDAVDRIIVDTDSEIIMQGVAERFPEVMILERPANLRPGTVPMNAVLAHDVQQVPSRFYLQTHSTNPLLRRETIEQAIAQFMAGYPEIDSLFGVTRLQTRLWTAEGEPVNHDPAELLRTQDLEPLYEENSCLYLFERSQFLERENRIGAAPMQFEIDRPESLDIDEEIDLTFAEVLLRSQG